MKIRFNDTSVLDAWRPSYFIWYNLIKIIRASLAKDFKYGLIRADYFNVICLHIYVFHKDFKTYTFMEMWTFESFW